MHDPSTQGCCTVDFGGQTLTLTGERAVWWAAERALLVADLHLGKPASFRDRGAPVPELVTASDLDRLSGLLDRFDAARLVVLGDLAHDRAAWRPVTLEAFTAWRRARAGLPITLVRGNHDRRAADPPADLGIETVEPGWSLGGVAMHHEPPEPGEDPVGTLPMLCGHLHPGVRLGHADRWKRRRPGLRAPCYWFSDRVGVLPAFGRFTGCAMVTPREGDRVFAVGDGRVLEVAGSCTA